MFALHREWQWEMGCRMARGLWSSQDPRMWTLGSGPHRGPWLAGLCVKPHSAALHGTPPASWPILHALKRIWEGKWRTAS